MIPIDEVRAEVELRDKAFATMRAGLALAGYELHVLAGRDGRAIYLVQRWNLHTELPDWAALVDWAERAGVQP